MLSGELAVLQAPIFDGLPFDPFALPDDGFGPAEIGIGGRHIVQALVVALMVVVLPEDVDLSLEVAGQEVVFQQNAVLEGLVPALDLALGLQSTLKGKTLFISGGSRGIGLAIALRAARDGANVAIAAKIATPHPSLPGTIHTAAEAIRSAGGRALPILCDIREADQVEQAIASTVEMLFAHLKRILKLDRLRLRGPNGAKDEFLLAATAQNLRKMAKLIPLTGRPLPI